MFKFIIVLLAIGLGIVFLFTFEHFDKSHLPNQVSYKQQIDQDQLIQQTDQLYRSAEREYNKKNYKEALPLMLNYIEVSKVAYFKQERLFWVIEQIGLIYLRIDEDYDKALSFFEKIKSDSRLSETEKDTINDWIISIRDFKTKIIDPDKITDPQQLFDLGKMYYEKAIHKQKDIWGDKGKAELNVAFMYLKRFITKYNDNENIGNALLMLGDIRRKSQTDVEYWKENIYFDEVIRRFPHTPLAMQAWQMMREELFYVYGSIDNETLSNDLLESFEQYRELAEPITN